MVTNTMRLKFKGLVSTLLCSHAFSNFRASSDAGNSICESDTMRVIWAITSRRGGQTLFDCLPCIGGSVRSLVGWDRILKHLCFVIRLTVRLFFKKLTRISSHIFQNLHNFVRIVLILIYSWYGCFVILINFFRMKLLQYTSNHILFPTCGVKYHKGKSKRNYIWLKLCASLKSSWA